MKIIRVTDDLVLEVHPGAGVRVLLRARGTPAVIRIRPDEIRLLIEALAEAAGMLAQEAATQ